MYKTKTESLTFEEELLAAVYFNNVAKVEWLIGMDYFKPSMVTEPIKVYDETIPLYWITICYKYLLHYEEYAKPREQVDKMLALWKERFKLDTDDLIDLKKCHKNDEEDDVESDEFEEGQPWFMGSLTYQDFQKSGAKDIDYELYKAVCTKNIQAIVDCLKRGAMPDAKIMDREGNPYSTFALLHYHRRCRSGYIYVPGKEKPIERYDIGALINVASDEQILYLLDQNINQRTITHSNTFSEFVPKTRVEDDIDPEVKESIDKFVIDIDKPGAILVMFDEGKVFASLDINDLCKIGNAYHYLIKRVLLHSKYIVIRVGGYSYRVAGMVLDSVETLPEDRTYVEHLTDANDEGNWDYRPPRIKTVYMNRYTFSPDMEIVKKAEEYDFKTYGNQSGSHTMVHFYVNNISTGWYDKKGEFFPFYDNIRGLQAITDVAMLYGYDQIAPATAAVATFTYDDDDDTIFAGSTVHKDRRSRTSSQKKLIEDSGVKFLDLTDKKFKALLEEEYKMRLEYESREKD